MTGLQLAILRILAQESPRPLLALRRQLTLHPATLGQAAETLVRRRLCRFVPSTQERRARVVAISRAGVDTLAAAPLAGPVRLRAVSVDPERAERLAAAFEDAIDVFGLTPWAPPVKFKTPGQEGGPVTIDMLGIDNVMFGVRDLDEAISFYEKAGFSLRFRLQAPPIALFGIGSERPGLLLRREAAPSAARFWVEVRDAEATREALASQGHAATTVETATGRTTEITDPSGNVVGYADYHKRPDLARPARPGSGSSDR